MIVSPSLLEKSRKETKKKSNYFRPSHSNITLGIPPSKGRGGGGSRSRYS